MKPVVTVNKKMSPVAAWLSSAWLKSAPTWPRVALGYFSHTWGCQDVARADKNLQILQCIGKICVTGKATHGLISRGCKYGELFKHREHSPNKSHCNKRTKEAQGHRENQSPLSQMALWHPSFHSQGAKSKPGERRETWLWEYCKKV